MACRWRATVTAPKSIEHSCLSGFVWQGVWPRVQFLPLPSFHFTRQHQYHHRRQFLSQPRTLGDATCYYAYLTLSGSTMVFAGELCVGESILGEVGLRPPNLAWYRLAPSFWLNPDLPSRFMVFGLTFSVSHREGPWPAP